jgi:monoamine oxidase
VVHAATMSATPTYDVVIVGAGVTGLRLATLLVKDAHLNVLVVEARDRVGGRTLSRRHGDQNGAAAVDLGATWCWPGEKRVDALLREVGVSAFPHATDGDVVVEGPGPAGESARIPGGNTGMEGARRFVGGTQEIAHALAARLPPGSLRLSTLVTGVRHSQADQTYRVTLSTDGDGVEQEVFASKAVALALPPALAGRLRLSPPLPDKLAAACQATPTFMGGIAKTVVIYPRPVWRDAGLSGTAFSRRGPLSEVHDHSPPGESSPFGALMGFSTTHDGAPKREAVVAQLVRLFGASAASPTEVLCLDWSNELHSTPPPLESAAAAAQAGNMCRRGLHDAVFAAGAWDGRLLLCSAETDTAAGGPHLEGALAAATRVAAAIDAL